MVDKAQHALIDAEVPIFVRGGMLVEPITVERPAAHDRTTLVTVFATLQGPKLGYLLNKHAAVFQRYDLSFPKIPSGLDSHRKEDHRIFWMMFAILRVLGMFVADMFKSRRRLEAENLFLRHQLNIALRRAPPRLRLHGGDRALLVWMTRLWPSLLGMSQVVQPETILRWHRSGFKAFWRWKSRNRAGRPKIDRELRDLIRRMSKENPLWGASRIHGELLMLGFEVAQSTVSKYMVRGRRPPSQTWKTFLRNHAEAIAAIDMCVVPTLTFDRLFAFLVLGHGRRQLLWFEVTRHPTAEWLARQITEAFPWASAPAYLVRDNDRAYGHVFTSRVRAMGIRDRPISPGSPWQNGVAERLIGTLRRECLDQMVIFGEAHLRPNSFHLCAAITINRAHTWHYRKIRRCVERSNGPATLSPRPFWPGYIIDTSGYDFRKGQARVMLSSIETTPLASPRTRPGVDAGLIEIDRVTIIFGKGQKAHKAVEETSIRIEPGEFVCILGPSGCGKSTLLNSVAGYVRPHGGQVRVDGEIVSGPGPDRGMVFQQYSLFPWKTVKDNVAFGPNSPENRTRRPSLSPALFSIW